jgi:hypothetical protein
MIDRSWGLRHLMPPPPPLGHPPIAITPDKVENNTPKKEGVRGMLLACCLPLGRRERVTLLAATENMRITKKKRISTEPKKQNTPTKNHPWGVTEKIPPDLQRDFRTVEGLTN